MKPRRRDRYVRVCLADEGCYYDLQPCDDPDDAGCDGDPLRTAGSIGLVVE